MTRKYGDILRFSVLSMLKTSLYIHKDILRTEDQFPMDLFFVTIDENGKSMPIKYKHDEGIDALLNSNIPTLRQKNK